MPSGWFASLGYWHQKTAYSAFDAYRTDPNRETFETAVNLALPVIRVVISTKKFNINYNGDTDDLIAHAALTITKALPKMIKKPVAKLDDDKKYMRYLFTCVINAFIRENDILHVKHNRLQTRIVEEAERPSQLSTTENFRQLEAGMALKQLPTDLYDIALDLIRFEDQERQICIYILNQLIEGREVAKSVLQLMGCKDRNFFIGYCQSVLFQAFVQLRKNRTEEVLYEQDFVEDEFFDGSLEYSFD